MIEVELRTFISEEKYNELLSYFKGENIDVKTQKQITYYFAGEQDFRMMITDEYCQLWLKKGKIHDDAREEFIVRIDKSYKDNLLNMLEILGFKVEIKWFRIRNSLKWNDVKVTLDYTYGYGYIMELELIVETEKEVEDGKMKLKELFNKLNVEVSEKKLFQEKYEDYKANWSKYTRGVNEDQFLRVG